MNKETTDQIPPMEPGRLMFLQVALGDHELDPKQNALNVEEARQVLMMLHHATAERDALQRNYDAGRQIYDDYRSEMREELQRVTDERNAAQAETQRLQSLLAAWRVFDEREDEWSAEIAATETNHEVYAAALDMVSHRFNKASLVRLVHWLIVGRNAARAESQQRYDELQRTYELISYHANNSRHLERERNTARSEAADWKRFAESLASASGNALGTLHVINAMANQIAKRHDDPNLDVVKNAETIMAERLIAHRELVDAINLNPAPTETKGSDDER